MSAEVRFLEPERRYFEPDRFHETRSRLAAGRIDRTVDGFGTVAVPVAAVAVSFAQKGKNDTDQPARLSPCRTAAGHPLHTSLLLFLADA